MVLEHVLGAECDFHGVVGIESFGVNLDCNGAGEIQQARVVGHRALHPERPAGWARALRRWSSLRTTPVAPAREVPGVLARSSHSAAAHGAPDHPRMRPEMGEINSASGARVAMTAPMSFASDAAR